MDELDMLKDVLATPGPSSDTVRKGRDELEQLIRHQSRTRRVGWRVAGIGLTAAAVALAVTAVVMVTSAPPAPGQARPRAPP